MITRKTLIKLPVIEITEKTFSFSLRKSLSNEMNTQAKEYYVCSREKGNEYSSCVYYLCENDPIKGTMGLQCSYSSRAVKFKTAIEAREAALKWIAPEKLRQRKVQFVIVGTFIQYELKYPKAKTTYTKSIAEHWYKDYRTYTGYDNQVCVWIEPGKDYIDIYLYLYDKHEGRIKPIKCNNKHDYSITTDYIFRFTKTGGILGVIQYNEKGKKVLLDARDWYLDKNDYSYKYDLRNISLNEDKFSAETMGVLKQSGFPSVYWPHSWGFHESPSRINNFGALMRCVNKSSSSKDGTIRSNEINDYCANIPFDEEHCVVPFKNGYIARFGRIIQAWQNIPYDRQYRSTRDYNIEEADPVEVCSVSYDPCVEVRDGKRTLVSKIVEEKFIESARLWISNTFSVRSVCISKCGGTIWEPSRIDLCDNSWTSDSVFTPKNPEYSFLGIDQEKFNKQVYEKLFKSHPRLKYLIGYTDQHPSLYQGDDIKFLRALFNYQKVIETFISLGKDNIFWKETSSGMSERETFRFDRFAENMRLNQIPHKASSDFYQILGLNKAQFKLIFNNSNFNYNEIMDVLYRISWCRLIPNFPQDGWRASDCKSRRAYSLIPVQYIETIIQIMEHKKAHHSYSNYGTDNEINELLPYGFDLKSIYKYMCVKNVDMGLYKDYLRMRDELERNSQRTHFDPHLWDKKLDDADDVRYTHDRILFVYNQWAAENARYRCIGNPEEEKNRQTKYNERYKKLKSFNYHEDDNEKAIIVPKELMEIVVEGQVLHHCVGSFVPSVSEGRDTIVFLRNKAMPDVPYATVSLLYDLVDKEWYIDQAHTAYNGEISEDDVQFLKRWGLKNKVRQSSIHIQYGAKCHH